MPIDGVLRDEVPIDDVAEHFVDAHPVLIDGEPLRRADYRGSNEAAVIEVELELISGLVAQRHAGQTPRQGIEQARRRRGIKIGGGKRLDIGRDLVAVDRAGLGGRRDGCRGRSGRGRRPRRRARGRQRRGTDDADLGKGGRARIRGRARSLLRGDDAGRHHAGKTACPEQRAIDRPNRRRAYATNAYSPPHGRYVPHLGRLCHHPRARVRESCSKSDREVLAIGGGRKSLCRPAGNAD